MGLVGEQSAPIKSDEEEKLSPVQRRRQVLRDYYRTHIDPVGRLIAEELAKLKDEEALVKRLMPETMIMEELEKPRQAYVFVRGVWESRRVQAGDLRPCCRRCRSGCRATGSVWRSGWSPLSIR